MNVRLVVQILSGGVAHATGYFDEKSSDCQGTNATVEFLRTFGSNI